MLIAKLHRKSPVSGTLKDARGCGKRSGSYTTSASYNLISAPCPTENSAIWKSVWAMKILPKVDFFVWTLSHRRILIGDNLKKKGWEGPTRCLFCLNHEETIEHLLISCSYAKEVWNLATPGGFTPPMEKNKYLLINWATVPPFANIKNPKIKSYWMSLPKFILWKLWLERNARIFIGKASLASQVATKDEGLLGDCLSHLWCDSIDCQPSASEQS